MYDYTLQLAKPNSVPWLEATKKAVAEKVTWQNVSPTQPATRQLLQQLQQMPHATPQAPTSAAPSQTTLPKTYETGSSPVFGAP